MKIFFTAAIL